VFEKMFSMNGFVNKLKALFFGPGWFPGTPRTGNYEDLPEVLILLNMFKQNIELTFIYISIF